MCWVLALACVVGCFSSARFEEAHEQRVASINSSADEMGDEVTNEAASQRYRLKQLRKFLIPVRQGAAYSPVDRVDMREDIVGAWKACDAVDPLADSDVTKPGVDAWSTSAKSALRSSCSSDFECSIGNRCVKNNYSGSGRCLRAVNEYGVQTFDTPRTSSVS